MLPTPPKANSYVLAPRKAPRCGAQKIPILRHIIIFFFLSIPAKKQTLTASHSDRPRERGATLTRAARLTADKKCAGGVFRKSERGLSSNTIGRRAALLIQGRSPVDSLTKLTLRLTTAAFINSRCFAEMFR